LAFNDVVIDANRASGELTVKMDGRFLLTGLIFAPVGWF
jgi:hypothetical protein